MPGSESESAGATRRPSDSVLGRLVNDKKHGPLPALLLGLTLLTGLVDAVSILSLGRVFVANMTGNVVFLAFAIACHVGDRPDRHACVALAGPERTHA